MSVNPLYGSSGYFHIHHMYPVGRCIITCDIMQHMTILFCRVDKGLESLFWSLFGLANLETFEIDKPEFQITRQTGVALFGLYQVLIAVVAINMLIAMMTRSFETIVVRFFMECTTFNIHPLQAFKCSTVVRCSGLMVCFLDSQYLQHPRV